MNNESDQAGHDANVTQAGSAAREDQSLSSSSESLAEGVPATGSRERAGSRLRTGSRERAFWKARWYLWDGGFLALGRSSGTVPLHAHHAIQITVALDGEFGMTAGDVSGTFNGVITAPDVEHRLEMRGCFTALLFVDPESHEGRWLGRSLQGPLTPIPQDKLERYVAILDAVYNEPLDGVDTARLIHAGVRGLCSGPPPSLTIDARVLRALEMIRQMDTKKIALEDIADAVFLSPSRFAHIFTETVGLPFRRYILWRRMTRAMLAVGRGKTLTAAAHSCGFSDSAHLTRACAQMFGQPPSVMLEAGEFYEIPAPFELPTKL